MQTYEVTSRSSVRSNSKESKTMRITLTDDTPLELIQIAAEFDAETLEKESVITAITNNKHVKLLPLLALPQILHRAGDAAMISTVRGRLCTSAADLVAIVSRNVVDERTIADFVNRLGEATQTTHDLVQMGLLHKEIAYYVEAEEDAQQLIADANATAHIIDATVARFLSPLLEGTGFVREVFVHRKWNPEGKSICFTIEDLSTIGTNLWNSLGLESITQSNFNELLENHKGDAEAAENKRLELVEQARDEEDWEAAHAYCTREEFIDDVLNESEWIKIDLIEATMDKQSKYLDQFLIDRGMDAALYDEATPLAEEAIRNTKTDLKRVQVVLPKVVTEIRRFLNPGSVSVGGYNADPELATERFPWRSLTNYCYKQLFGGKPPKHLA